MAENGKYRINDEIVGVKEVRLIPEEGDASVVPFHVARRFAEDAGLDLVEVAAQANPPVCKILDFQKFRYAEEKREKEAAKKQRVANKQQEIKEIRFRPVTDENDYNVKLRSLTRFLEEGYRAKATVRFRGREISHVEIGTKMIERMIADLAESGAPEAPVKSFGKDISVVFVPKKKKAA